MEADWAAEIGANLPKIVVPWEGFIDLRRTPVLVAEIAEATNYPALFDTLTTLNAPVSPVFTSKCDVWMLGAEEIDPLEFDAAAQNARRGMACYVDLLHRSSQAFASFGLHELWARRLVAGLRESAAGQGRVDLVIRAAQQDDEDGFGITLYAAGCGHDQAASEAAWNAVLCAAVAATISEELQAGE